MLFRQSSKSRKITDFQPFSVFAASFFQNLYPFEKLQSEFYFLESRKDFEKDLRKIKIEVVENAKLIFSKFSKLEGYYEYCIGDVINNKRQLPNEGFDWVVEYLIATKVIDPSNYELVKGLVLQRVEYMKGRNNPNIKLYYPEIPTILKDLENTDFKEIEWTDSV